MCNRCSSFFNRPLGCCSATVPSFSFISICVTGVVVSLTVPWVVVALQYRASSFYQYMCSRCSSFFNRPLGCCSATVPSFSFISICVAGVVVSLTVPWVVVALHYRAFLSSVYV